MRTHTDGHKYSISTLCVHFMKFVQMMLNVPTPNLDGHEI